METALKLYTLNYSNVKTYLFAILFVVGNILLPQLAHLAPNGGLIFLPIYFFTLIAAYKYGIWVGLLTAVLSPLSNYLFFGMPSAGLLPVIMVKSVLLASVAAYAAHRFGKVSILILIGVVLISQLLGTAFEWAYLKDFYMAVQDFRLGIPGILIQIFGGYVLLRLIAKI